MGLDPQRAPCQTAWHRRAGSRQERALCWSRAATLTASPVMSVSPSAATTSPVLTPMRSSNSERRDLAAQLEGSASRAQCVVLVDGGDSEHGHDRIANEFLHGRAVTLEHGPRRVEVARHDAPHHLGIVPLPHLCRSGDIGEEHGDGLPDHEPSLGGTTYEQDPSDEASKSPMRPRLRGADRHCAFGEWPVVTAASSRGGSACHLGGRQVASLRFDATGRRPTSQSRAHSQPMDTAVKRLF